MNRVVSSVRYLVLLGVLGLLVAGVATFVYGGISTVHVIWEAFTDTDFDAVGARELSIELIEMIDLFLLGAVLFVIAVGLYQLFIDPAVDVPHWLVFKDLEQLKATVLVVVIVMLSILFLGEAASLAGESDDLLDFGLGVGAFFAGLAVVTWVFQRIIIEDEQHIDEERSG